MTFYDPAKTLICDIETYHGYFLIAFKRLSDGKVRTFELSDRSSIDREKIRAILMQNKIITYNGMTYDIPLIWYFIEGATNAKLKQASDQIIQGGVKYWEVEALLGIRIPRLDHIDLIEPQPNAWASLKTLNGRLHGRKMQDLPIEPHARLSHADMDGLTTYCINDLDATELLFNSLIPALELRAALSKEYGIDFMSKSDSQIGEGIIKKRVEQLTGERLQRVETPAGTMFPYIPPDYLRFETPLLQNVLSRLRANEFVVRHDRKVELPAWLGDLDLTIGQSTYAMGIGGLHSTEANRAVHADDDHVMIDFDVASYYPAIIINSGLYPRSVGRAFLDVYRAIRDERVVAKRRMQELAKEIAILKSQLNELETSNG